MVGPGRIVIGGQEYPFDGGAGILTRREFDSVLNEVLDDEDNTLDFEEGWWCVRTDPFRCPAEGCDFVARFLTAVHRVVVWPENDDPAMLRQAHNAKVHGRNPTLVEYQPDFGPCIAWDQWRHLGRPLHWQGERPANWPPSFSR